MRFVTHIQESYRRKDVRIWLGLIWIAAVSSAIVLYRTGAWFQSPAALAGLGMAFGGAAGNLMDILRRRYVIDFIDLGWWPVFNLADVGIVVGLTVAFWNQQ
jgi:signal peptidase II